MDMSPFEFPDHGLKKVNFGLLFGQKRVHQMKVCPPFLPNHLCPTFTCPITRLCPLFWLSGLGIHVFLSDNFPVTSDVWVHASLKLTSSVLPIWKILISLTYTTGYVQVIIKMKCKLLCFSVEDDESYELFLWLLLYWIECQIHQFFWYFCYLIQGIRTVQRAPSRIEQVSHPPGWAPEGRDSHPDVDSHTRTGREPEARGREDKRTGKNSTGHYLSV